MVKKRRIVKNKIKKELEKKCIRKFFFIQYKDIAKAGGKKMQSLGLEASLEACEGLFVDGKLLIKVFDENTYFVFLKHDKDRFELIYDSTK